MAETAGLVVGVASLAVTLKTCIELFGTFHAAWKLDRDLETLVLKLNIEKALLVQWAQQSGLVNAIKTEAAQLRGLEDLSLALRILEKIKDLLGNGDDLKRKFGGVDLTATGQPAPNLNSCVIDLGKARLDEVTTVLDRLSLKRSKKATGNSAPLRVLKWAFYSKEKFSALIQELDYFISSLRELLPATELQTRALFKEDLQSIRDILLGQHIHTAALDGAQADAAAEHVHLLKRRQRVLDCLWFRRIKERYNNLKPPNPDTFEWVLQEGTDTESVQWASVPVWLQESRHSIYWICGKAAAGKSTLMRFIYNHPKTTRYLETWAGSSTLRVAGFFFYYLGSEEQKSQEGLFRGLLHDLLQVHPELIPEVLPEMWREASILDEKLSFPSLAEMTLAFRRLSNATLLDHKYCLFIDGLDEYSGPPAEVVDIVCQLSNLPNMRLMVSSRPINSCHHAFRNQPQLKLEDLTRADMAKYVEDVLGCNVNTASVPEEHARVFPELRSELVQKATGVFLWLVLVCKRLSSALSDGEDWNTVLQLAERMPRGLESLFQYMFDKISPLHRQWAFRVLETCRRQQKTSPSDSLDTLAFALADDHGMNFDTLRSVHPRVAEEDVAKCAVFEARLRARCCGLVETFADERMGLYAPPSPDNSYEPEAEEAYHAGRTSVRFVHRTLPDYMETKDYASFSENSWPLDADFDAGLTIALVQLHGVYAYGLRPPGIRYLHYVKDSYSYEGVHQILSCILDSVDSTSVQKLSQLVLLLDQLSHLVCEATEQNRDENDGLDLLIPQCRPHHIRLALAVEFENREVFDAILVNAGSPRLTAQWPELPLLYHFWTKPMFRTVVGHPDEDSLYLDGLSIDHLLRAGCDPNELLCLTSTGDGATVWSKIFAEECSETEWKDDLIEEVLEMFKILLEHGADVQVAKAIFTNLENNGGLVEENYRFKELFWEPLRVLLDKFDRPAGGVADATSEDIDSHTQVKNALSGDSCIRDKGTELSTKRKASSPLLAAGKRLRDEIESSKEQI